MRASSTATCQQRERGDGESKATSSRVREPSFRRHRVVLRYLLSAIVNSAVLQRQSDGATSGIESMPTSVQRERGARHQPGHREGARIRRVPRGCGPGPVKCASAVTAAAPPRGPQRGRPGGGGGRAGRQRVIPPALSTIEHSWWWLRSGQRSAGGAHGCAMGHPARGGLIG